MIMGGGEGTRRRFKNMGYCTKIKEHISYQKYLPHHPLLYCISLGILIKLIFISNSINKSQGGISQLKKIYSNNSVNNLNHRDKYRDLKG